jgi:hypothetical protein
MLSQTLISGKSIATRCVKGFTERKKYLPHKIGAKMDRIKSARVYKGPWRPSGHEGGL